MFIKATFNGKHNRTKVIVLITLYERKKKGLPGLTLAELSETIPINYSSLSASLVRYCRQGWDYCNKRIGLHKGKPSYRYEIAHRGVHFLEHRVPPDVLQDCLNQINEFRGAVNG